MEALTEPAMQQKPFEAGEGIEFKILDDKILITGQSRTLIKEGNFILDGKIIHIEAGPGVKVSSRGKDTLVISANLAKMEEAIFDLRKEMNDRLTTVEKFFVSLGKQLKKT